MNRPLSSGRSVVDHVAKAHLAWGDEIPDWILVLAEACRHSTQAAVAQKLSYSASTISQVLTNKYQLGDMRRVEQMVRGALMAETIPCPTLGDITRNICLEWQAKPYAATSSLRAQMYRACRQPCPHSRFCSDKGDADAF